MPWILCGPGWPPESTGKSSGSTATMRTPGLRAFSTWPTPVMVPPVPTPETTTSTPPAVSFQISSAVVRRWISGLAGFSNCCGMTAPGVAATISLALAIAPFMPCAAGVRDQFGAQQGEHLAPLDRHQFGHHEDELIAARRGHEGERDAGVAGGRLDQKAASRA